MGILIAGSSLQIIDHALDQLPAGQSRQRLDRGIDHCSCSRWSGGLFICTQAVTPTLQADADGSPLLIEPAPGIYVSRIAASSARIGLLSLGECDDGAINLGDLRTTDGSSNDNIPPGISIRCRAIAILCGTGPLVAS